MRVGVGVGVGLGVGVGGGCRGAFKATSAVGRSLGSNSSMCRMRPSNVFFVGEGTCEVVATHRCKAVGEGGFGGVRVGGGGWWEGWG